MDAKHVAPIQLEKGGSPSLCWLSEVLAERHRVSSLWASQERGEMDSCPYCDVDRLVSSHSKPCSSIIFFQSAQNS